MQIQNLADIPTSPWKNGGGSTRTLFVHPPHATMDDFLWRISLADVAAPGPFSRFPGVDRTILLWSGAGILLQAPTWTYSLDRPFESFTFPGEEPITSTLIAGPTTDVNIMVRRNHTQATVVFHNHPLKIPAAPGVLIVLCITGTIHLLDQTIPANHFLRLDDHPPLALTPTAGSAYLLIHLTPCFAPSAL